jgi:hypothetical protein
VDNYFFVSVEDYNNNFSSNLIISENENSVFGFKYISENDNGVVDRDFNRKFTDNQTNKREYFCPVSIEDKN